MQMLPILAAAKPLTDVDLTPATILALMDQISAYFAPYMYGVIALLSFICGLLIAQLFAGGFKK